VNGFSCACAAGYEGATCETDIDECASAPCLNGGECTDEVNGFSCACAAGYEGATCETDIDDCSPNPCESGGSCVDGGASFTCECAYGFSGEICENALVTNAPVGHPGFASPHSQPIAILPDGSSVYVVNTPADTVDVLDAATGDLVTRVHVGIDPVAVAARPDGLEVWVSNHVSDSISIIDTDPASPRFNTVVATVQDFDQATRSTRFDEPVGIAFSDDSKAYVALSSSDRIAVIDVDTRAVTGHLDIGAQEPRALTVRDGRLYVVAFESGNQTELSGCFGAENIDGDQCTFDLDVAFALSDDPTLGYDVDIVRDPDVPDRDLFVFDTATDELFESVWSVGTLLYGLTVDSAGRVYVAQTEARNDTNGRAWTLQHKLVDLQNRAYLNQIGVIDCGPPGNCGQPTVFDLEPLPPENPALGMALATPFGIQITEDDTTLVVTAAGSHRLFTVDAMTGTVLGRVDVGLVPRGVSLRQPPGGGLEAWTFNAVANSVSVVDLSDLYSPVVTDTIILEDPTHPDVKQGRYLFNDANASSSQTFACASCHPDGHIDQLVWNLGAPPCEVEELSFNVEGCDQSPPRVSQPIRGLRDTAPYHWDGIPGDPYGGPNGQYPFGPDVAPNCTDVHSCALDLVNGALGSTMCDQTDCPSNEEGKAGLLGAADRDAMATFLLSVPYPTGRERPYDDQLTSLGRQGFHDWFDNDGVETCGKVGCHQMPLGDGTDHFQLGMDAPSIRGLTDRWTIRSNARHNIIEFVTSHEPGALEIPYDEAKGFDERFMFGQEFGTVADPGALGLDGELGPLPSWQMMLELSTGFSGAFARQVTLNESTAAAPNLSATEVLLDALELASAEELIVLQGEGSRVVGQEVVRVVFSYGANGYTDLVSEESHSRTSLLADAASGSLTLTLTARLGTLVDVEHAQPLLWAPIDPTPGMVRHDFPQLPGENPMTMYGSHIPPDAHILVDGRRVDGSVACGLGGVLPDCTDEVVSITLVAPPVELGMHLLQVQTPGGLLSNEFLIFMQGCGDDICNLEETCTSCQVDCGECAVFPCVDWVEVAAILDDPAHGCSGTCHSAQTKESGLDLSTMSAAKAGGAHGAAVVECDPDNSYLYLKPSWIDWFSFFQFGQQMPLDTFGAVGLSVSELETIYNWVGSGAQEVCVPNYCN
jgi:YVTN family beta-propeller protein